MKSLTSGRSEVAEIGEPMQLHAGSMEAQDIDIVALATNTGVVWVGDYNVRAAVGNETGVPLDPGLGYHLEAVDLSTVYIDSVTAGEGVTWNIVHDV